MNNYLKSRIALTMEAKHVNLWYGFDIEPRTDIAIVVIALLGIAIVFLWVAFGS